MMPGEMNMVTSTLSMADAAQMKPIVGVCFLCECEVQVRGTDETVTRRVSETGRQAVMRRVAGGGRIRASMTL